ncbi:MAG: flavodoxin [Dysgonamonadaceae bacterium]|jgi:flavodoxin I|nr:flavodoxin [Dysgonamonadaceae bacterium]
MEKIGIFYSIDAVKTATVAQEIIEALGKDNVEIVSVEQAWKEDFEKYNNIIIGVSTWFDGELPTYWDELIPELSDANLKNKRIAIFGLGDQLNYPENFADGVGILAEKLTGSGAKLTGFTSPEGYKFEYSKALKGNQFQGLIIDVENQNNQTKKRIKDWVKTLEFK